MTPLGSDRDPPSGPWLRQGQRTVCSSVEELSALWPGARFESDADDFYANALRLQFDGFRIETALNSAYTCVRDDALIEQYARPAIAIEVVLEGRIHRHQQGLDYIQHSGQAAVTLLDEPFDFAWAGPGRSVRSVAALSLLTSDLQRPGAVRPGLLPPSPLIAAYVGFVSNLVDVAEPVAAAHRSLEVAGLALHRAVLMEAQQPGLTPRQQLRDRVERYIDEHLDDRDLSPANIARALAVSVRAVHAAFNGADLTVAAEVRRRRVLAAADLLCRVEAPAIVDIARTVGFGGTDQLRRNFLATLGLTPAEYARQQRSSGSASSSSA